MAKLLKQVIIRRDNFKHPLAVTIPKSFLEGSGIKRGDYLNVYLEDDKTLRIVAEVNPFGTPEEISLPGRKAKV